MQTTIDHIREAYDAAMLAIHSANLALGDSPEIDVLIDRLQNARIALREADNEAVRIKSRTDLDANC
ncbi:hypothetical protein B7759_01368 [Burkholderia glumae]|uniref:hypothetical protein n=1 Tax=Burkholderia glumae TaxID=337 RepID=UPI001AE18598|nr:hypothetical protein [Burkholderia glumae]QTP32790.1 hypothetical protein B7759_01368 [Burkholderia glumae]